MEGNYAKGMEAYYKNNGSSFLKKEVYDFFKNLYWEGYQDLMIQDDYISFIESVVVNGVDIGV